MKNKCEKIFGVLSFMLLFSAMSIIPSSSEELSVDFNQAPGTRHQALGTRNQGLSNKVVEIETDIDEEQIKKSTPVVKPTIKPRQDYKTSNVKRETSYEPAMPSAELSTTGDQRPGTRHQAPGTSDQEPGTSDQEPATSDQEPATNGQASETNHQEPTPNLITDKQFVELSETLRHLIEDNNKLKDQIAGLDAQLKTARGQQKLDAKRYGDLTLERDTLRQQNEKIAGLGEETENKLKALQKQLTEKEQNYNVQIIQLQTELAQLTKNIPPDVLVKLTNVPNPIVSPPATIVQPPAERTAESGKSKTQGEEAIAESEKRKAKSEEKSEQENLSSASTKSLSAQTSDVRSISVDVVSSPSGQAASVEGDKILMSMDRVKNEKQKLVRDEARVHYNMGNTFFNEGDYVNAAVEYKRTIELTPEDSSAHYNLAFVSGEYLNHPRAAMEHYKKYLFYNPHAEDAEQVRQKIIEAEILVKSEMKFNSNINEEIRSKKNEVSRMLSQ